MEIWINPRCSKCRTALSTLDEAGVQYTVRRYLEDPPSAAELTGVLERLGLEPWDVARLDEDAAKELDLRSWGRTEADRARWVEAMSAHPQLIQRPIITADDGYTVIGRTPDALDDVISH
ncbi:arsenate reductase family protein [Kitasatospora sp. NPDC057198]|uniref:arsenate reductase family protein n=1 Tax=Kitasatospora sp. NPDC057198 TaxID=3346046 RepID=UPI00362E546B